MEHILTPKVENVTLVDKFNPRSSPVGTLYLTTTHLIFVSNAADGRAALPGSDHRGQAGAGAGAGAGGGDKRELWILHMLIHTVEKPLLTTSGTQLRVLCSNFQAATFIVQRDRDAHDVFLSLQALSRPREFADLYCFSYNPKGEVRQRTGWHFHDLGSEFQRQGVPNEHWAHCTMNRDYSLCPTYPRDLFVPASASQGVVEGSAKFRSKSRLPVLTYLHGNKAAIVRCAQPLVGISGVRSPLDERYVECLRLATPGAPLIHVVDTRPQMNALANRAGGKGYESDKYYENIQFSFRGIENIHKMRASLKMMVASLSAATSMDGFLSELSNSGWLKHVKAVLDASAAIAAFVLEGRSVIVHCSDGWDRTAQTCALAGLMLDGYYRTVQGFQALVEKDWLSFGHKFSDRCGHLDGDPNETSPTFGQFLDCVWQLTQQFPQAFGFNERYLIAIHEHAHSAQYGTFVGNCPREREALSLSERTYSLWGHLTAHHDDYANPLYQADTSGQVLRPDTAPQNIRFWAGLYCRFENGAHPREPPIDLLSVMQNHTSSLEDHSRQLTRTLGTMSQMLASAKGAGAAVASKVASAAAAAGAMAQSPTKEAAPAMPPPGTTETALDDGLERNFANMRTPSKCHPRLNVTGLLAMRVGEASPGLLSLANSNRPELGTNELEDNDATLGGITPLDGHAVRAVLHSVAVNWAPLNQWSACRACDLPLVSEAWAQPRAHCRRCGQLFCGRCCLRRAALPGHESGRPATVCGPCARALKRGGGGRDETTDDDDSNGDSTDEDPDYLDPLGSETDWM